MDYINEINNLKKEKNALILAHNYQSPEVQDIADILGDSFELAKKIKNLKEDTIVFCGVKFMAETAKILAPNKTILMPEIDAGCPMADMIKYDELLEIKKEYKDYTFVCYINTNAEIKTLCDVVVTSANALNIIKKIDNNKIYFLPDQFLGSYIQDKLKEEGINKEIKLYNGFCPVHQVFSIPAIKELRKQYSGSVFMAHPESSYEVQEEADYLVGTGGMIRLAKENPAETFLVGTEIGMVHRLQELIPEKKFIKVDAKLVCKNMKKTTLEKIYKALKENQYEINVNPDIASKAKYSINKMLELAD